MTSPLASDGMSVWVTLKTTTTTKNSPTVMRKKWVFRASTTGVVLGGDSDATESSARPSSAAAAAARASGDESQPANWMPTLPDNDGIQGAAGGEARAAEDVAASAPGATDQGRRTLRVPDSSFSREHIRVYISPLPEPDQGAPANTPAPPRGKLFFSCPSARTYFQLGQGRHSNGPIPIVKNAVIKLGACSLAVSDLCTGAETPEERLQQQSLSQGGGEGGNFRRIVDPEDTCYICYETGPGEAGDDPLGPSPCMCAKPVHRSCLQRWIMVRQSRACSICRKPLPLDLTVEAPFAVLTVVRHVRGLHWRGQKEYVTTFRNRSGPVGGIRTLSLGSSQSCDVCIADHSVSAVHARLSFSKAAVEGSRGTFFIEDLQSTSGTYLRVSPDEPFCLPLPSPPAPGASASAPCSYTFKVGRTVLNLRVQLVVGKGPPSLAMFDAIVQGAGGLARAFRARLDSSSGSAHVPTQTDASHVARINHFAIIHHPSAALPGGGIAIQIPALDVAAPQPVLPPSPRPAHPHGGDAASEGTGNDSTAPPAASHGGVADFVQVDEADWEAGVESNDLDCDPVTDGPASNDQGDDEDNQAPAPEETNSSNARNLDSRAAADSEGTLIFVGEGVRAMPPARGIARNNNYP